MRRMSLETSLKIVLVTLATGLSLFILGTRLYQEYHMLTEKALHDGELAREVVLLLTPEQGRAELARLEPEWIPAGGRNSRKFVLSDGSHVMMAINHSQIAAALVDNNRILLVVAIVGLLVSVEVAVLVSYSMTSALRRLAWGCSQLAKGRFVRLPEKSMVPQELATVTEIFNHMAQQIEQWRRLQPQIARMDRLASMGEIMSGVAHEVRNPLASMMIHLNLMQHQIDEQSPLHPHMEIMEAELDRLNRTVDRFLEFARPRPVSRDTLYTHELLSWCAGMVAPQAGKRGISTQVESEPGLAVEGDRDRLCQMLLNLCLNGINAMGTGGKLCMKAYGHGAHVCICVSDTGSGIADVVRDRMFEPFVTTRPDGTGLGLAIVRQVIQEHDGTIDVESSDRGTNFTLRMYRAQITGEVLG